MSDVWKRCSVCKKEIAFGGSYYVCSVSTCNRKRTGLTFCSVDCWDAHLPTVRHRSDAGAIEETAPSRAEALAAEAAAARPAPPAAEPRRSVPAGQEMGGARAGEGTMPTDVLVVASKVKQYIRDRSGMNTSASTMEALTRCVIALCEKGIENAREAERKTVMDRDIPPVER